MGGMRLPEAHLLVQLLTWVLQHVVLCVLVVARLSGETHRGAGGYRGWLVQSPLLWVLRGLKVLLALLRRPYALAARVAISMLIRA